MKYEPAPGTLAFRALAYIRALDDKRSEISNPTLAATLNCVSGDLIAALKRSVEEGLLFGRQKGGHTRSPMFWSLVDHSKHEGYAPPPGPQTPIAPTPHAALWPPALDPVPSTDYPPLSDLEQDDTPTQRVTKVKRGQVDPSLRETITAICETNPLQSVWAPSPVGNPGINIDEVHRTRDNVVEMEYIEGQDSQQVLKAEPATADATDREHPADASPSVDTMGAGQAVDATALGDRIGVPTRWPTPAGKRASISHGVLSLVDKDEIRFGAWSNGELHIQRGGQIDVLSRREFAQLIEFLNSISLESVCTDPEA